LFHWGILLEKDLNKLGKEQLRILSDWVWLGRSMKSLPQANRFLISTVFAVGTTEVGRRQDSHSPTFTIQYLRFTKRRAGDSTAQDYLEPQQLGSAKVRFSCAIFYHNLIY
jgi:hypothetical protein